MPSSDNADDPENQTFFLPFYLKQKSRILPHKPTSVWKKFVFSGFYFVLQERLWTLQSRVSIQNYMFVLKRCLACSRQLCSCFLQHLKLCLLPTLLENPHLWLSKNFPGFQDSILDINSTVLFFRFLSVVRTDLLVYKEVHLYLTMSNCQEIGAGKADEEREFNFLFRKGPYFKY